MSKKTHCAGAKPRSAASTPSANALQRQVEQALEALQSGRLSEAERACLAVLETLPNELNALQLLALAVKRQGRLEEAEGLLRRAVALAPREVSLLNNLGNTLRESGRLTEAAAVLQEALRIAPDYLEAWNNLGNIAKDGGDFTTAATHYRRALTLRPDYPDALNNLGGVLQKQGDLAGAIAAYRRAIEGRPAFAMAHYNLANALTDAGALDEAIAHFREALRHQPDYVEALNGLLRQLQTTCQWAEVSDLSARLRAFGTTSGKVFPFSFLAIDSSEAEQQLCARRWVEVQYEPLRRLAREHPFRFERPTAARRLRVGYLSSDLHDHATAWLMAEVFELHDRTRFEVHAFSLGPDDGRAMRCRLRNAIEHFHDIRGMPWLEAARFIHAHGIDVLVDLKGYTKDTGSPILALRPAPIQVNYLGYPGTLGTGMADYILGDRTVTPLSSQTCFDECFAWLPASYQCNDRQRLIGARPSRAACGLPDSGVVYCCFNHTYKISEAVFSLWCEILIAVPKSVLWLLKSNRWAEDNLRREAVRRGLSPERLVFADNRPLAEHLGRLQNADLFLDTRPYNAHTTCSDALWSGVPVVTREGNTFASRVAASLLRAVGLPQLIAKSDADYRDMAIALGHDTTTRNALKQHLVHNRRTLPLFDSPRFTHAIESLYVAMWSRWLAGEAPAAMQCGPLTQHAVGAAAHTHNIPNG